MEGKIKEEVKEQMRAKKNMFDGNKMVMTTIFIIVTAVIFLAIGYVAGKNSDDTTESVALETATVSPSVTKTAAASSSATGTTDETADWKTYTNTKYNFTITLTDKWQGYQVVEKTEPEEAEASYRFYVPTSEQQWSDPQLGAGYAGPFVIQIFSKSTYESLRASANTDDPFDLEYGSKIADNGTYVATYSTWQDAPEDLIKSGLANEVREVINTFQFTK